MIQRMWPGGVQPETARPYIVPRRSTDAPERRDTIALEVPMEVVIYVPTQGASIGYSTEEGPNAKWRLYTGPIRVDRPMTLRAKRSATVTRRARKRASCSQSRSDTDFRVSI